MSTNTNRVNNPMKVITGPDTRWSYANVWEPKSINGGTPKYSVSLIIPKSDTKTVAKIKAAIEAAYQEGQSKLKGNSKSVPPLAAIKTPLRDGDIERPDDLAYANAYFINANSATAPGIVDADRNPVLTRSEVYSGVYGRASIIQMQNLPQNHLSDLAEARGLVRCGDFEGVEMLYEDVPDTLSQLIRTAFVPQGDRKFIVADFSAIEARVIAWLAGEEWRQKVFAEGKDIYCASASQMFGVPVEKHGINGHLRQKGKIAELALGYGGSVGALKAMGALDMGLTEDELPPLVDAWRQANPKIVQFWWTVDRAVMEAVRFKRTNETHGITFACKGGMLFITLPSGRRLAYVKPKIGTNKFGGDCITYEGVGSTKKWERLDSYGPKFVENIVQATARDILCYAMKTLRCCSIVMHIHDEVVIEANRRMSMQAVCDQMGRTPPWAKGLQLRADGYETDFYKKD